MTESMVAPGPFKGQQTDEPITWLKRFTNYCKFKAYDEARQTALFCALMQDTASDWLESIPDQTVFSDMEKLFTDRFKCLDITRFKNAKDLFSTKQLATETVDQYIEKMTRLGRRIPVNQEVILYACQNGIRPELAPFTLQKEPKSLEDLRAAGRLAELTVQLPAAVRYSRSLPTRLVANNVRLQAV